MLGKGNLKKILAFVPRRDHCLPVNASAIFFFALLITPTNSFAQWTNEPPGSTTILDCPFSGPSSDCGINDVYHSEALSTDPSAPISPPGISVDTLEPFAKTGGSQRSYLFGNNYREAFMGMMVRTNPEFEGRIVGNKMAFIRGPDSNGLLILASEARLKPGGSIIFNHNSGNLDNSHTCAADLGLICYANAGGGYLTKGQWTKIELYIKASTTNTSRDGIVRWWVNGQLAGNYENMNYGGAGLNEWVWTETWDGAGDMGTSNTVRWHWYFDHLYLSIPNCPDGCKLSGWNNLPPGNPPTLPPGTTDPPPPVKPGPLLDPKTIPLDPTIIYQHLKDVGDFKPHYGLLPIPWPLPFPVVVPQGIGRGLWCYGPVYIQTPFGPYCLPIPRNWCYQFAQCFATNTLNLISTLQIKYAWPEGQGRLEDPKVTKDPMPADFYSRDMCVTGAKLDYNRFDPKTGALITPKFPGSMTNSDSSAFDERATGTVIGSKPVINSCMTTVDTPKFDPPATDNSRFTYYMNMANDPFLSRSGEDTKARKSIYGTSNYYLSTTFFIGSQLGCPDNISGMSGDRAESGQAWLEAANKCYSWFLYQRATHPEWTLERPGSGTDFALTRDQGRGGDPDLAIFNTCQPLMSGHNSRLVAKGETPVGKGFAPILQYDRADLDEADYSPAHELIHSFGEYFKGETAMPQFHNIFPCLIKPNDAGPNKVTDWEKFNTTLFVYYAVSFSVEVSVLDLSWGPMYFIPMSNKDPYVSVGAGKPGFCPNVEKIVDPASPFAPRNDYNDKADYRSLERQQELIKNATLDQFSINPPNTALYANDREYSFQTKVFTPRDRIFHDWEFAYSEFNPTMTNPPTADPSVRLNSLKYPEVQCAVVPVDIMEWRRKSFDNCIMQRINFNFLTWRRRNFLSYYYKETLEPWKKPCVTRFWEHDTYDKCPVSMSIQQCCRIIVKDVVPLNYLKIRTCEGLRQKRNFVFGFDHIFDYAEKASADSTTSGTPVESFGGKAVRFPMPGEPLSGDDMIFQPLPSPAERKAYENAPFSDDDRANAQKAYDQIYLINQKLSLIGCDDTEPETYRFDHYFKHSRLEPIDSNAISNGMAELRKASDLMIKDAKEVSLQAVLAAFGPNSAPWAGYNEAKVVADSIIESGRAGLNAVIAVENKARIRYQNALRNFSMALSPAEAALLAVDIIPRGLPIAIGEEYLTALVEFKAAEAQTKVAAAAFNEVSDTQRGILQYIETGIKNRVTEMLALQENFLMANTKAEADNLVRVGAEQLRSSLGPQLLSAVELTVNQAVSNTISHLAMQELGEGGAHMPYMRWFDTGTSAGNPLRGGSFVNTLGSYDTIIGVGHEERNYDDATSVIPDMKEEYNPKELEDAAKIVAEKTAELKVAKDELFQKLDAWNNNSATGEAGTPIWFGLPDQKDTILHSSAKRVGISEICYLTRQRSDGTYIDCSEFNKTFPPLQDNIYKLRLALNDAQRKLDIADGTIVQDTSENPVSLTYGQSLISPSRMGRINGWEGLKGHQMWTLRRQNMACIGRYEKIFKPYGPENFVLSRAGASWKTRDGVQWAWPLAWRGYINDPENEFEQNIYSEGLDNAQVGDIIIVTINGLKRIYYVNFANQTNPRYVKVEGWDQGKFPTSTGSGLSLGTGVEHTIYKNPGDVPEAARRFKVSGSADPDPVDINSIAEAAKVSGVPSCEDPDYTNCVLGGDGVTVNEEFVPNSTWENVKIYRPSEDTDRRQCPMFNSANVVPNPNLDTTQMPSDAIAYCIGAGFDPPPAYTSMPYNGTGAGNLSDTTLCGPRWGDCVGYARARQSCFPGNELCGHESGASATPPAGLPPGKVDCTPDQLKEAAAAYSDDIKSMSSVNTKGQAELKGLVEKVKELNTRLNDLVSESNLSISSQQSGAASSKANSEIAKLNSQLTSANARLDAAERMTIPAPVIVIDPVTKAQTVSNQQQINAATSAKQSAISAANSEIAAISGNIKNQQKIVESATKVSDANSDLIALQSEATAAAQDLYNYIEEHKDYVPVDSDEDLTPAQQAGLKAIQDNISALSSKATAAQNKVTSAINKLNGTQSGLNELVPLTPELKEKQDEFNKEIADLKKEIEAANAEVKAAQDAIMSGDKGMPELPKFTCPYKSLSGEVFGGNAEDTGSQDVEGE